MTLVSAVCGHYPTDWFDAVDGFFVNVGYPSAWTYSPKVNPPPEEGGAAAPLPATSGGVTIVPAPIDLPKEHAPKFKYEVQRQLTADARQALTHVVHDRILHPIRFWFDVYERCKVSDGDARGRHQTILCTHVVLCVDSINCSQHGSEPGCSRVLPQH